MIRPLAMRLGLFAAILAIAVAATLYGVSRLRRDWSPDPQTIATASLEGLREQNRLSAFVASYVAVVTSTQSRFGLDAQKTLILPGTVRYEVDLAKIGDDDVRYDAGARQLDVVLPEVELVGPEIDLTRMREYDGGGILMRLTDAERALDASNRRAGQAELLRQARAPVPMNLARDATRRAVERSFALPLRAAGLAAEVRVRFQSEPDFPARNDEQMERSRAVADVLEERRAATTR